MRIKKGFTLIELMIVVVVLAILAAIALPSYQAYVRKGNEKLALQKIADLSLELEKEKTRNFSYEGLDGENVSVKSGSKVLYDVEVSAELRKWSIKACVDQALDDASLYKNFSLTSTGLTCEGTGDCETALARCIEDEED